MLVVQFRGCKQSERILQTLKAERNLPRIRGCSSVGRAPALQAGGRQFEPVHLHQAKSGVKSTTIKTKWAHSSDG